MKFKKDDLEFYLPDSFKGLSKDYLLECIFDDDIQSKWNPSVGDIIVGSTGNVSIISVIDNLHESLGGKRYYFGGGSCNRDGGNVLDSTFCYTANENGKYIHPIYGEQYNLNHCSIRDFRYVPYPHEKNENMNNNELSEAELKMVKYFDFEDIIETIRPIDLYRLMVDKSFRYNDKTVYSSALRKAWKEISDFKKYRNTPEFDKIILDELNRVELDCNIEEENNSPYCELCGGCGEDGCCSL